ncbi:MAG: hypothetical protein QMD46_05055 [Methanomicrobiales archaeon]|nr:hypothetical protein [Methanomicrobiales archaeon]
MERRYALWFIWGLGLLAIGILGTLIFPRGLGEGSTAILITSGIVVLVATSAKLLRCGEGPQQDERTRRIGAWGLSYSWFTTFLLLFVLFWIDYLELIRLETQAVLLVLVLTMALSARLFQWHFFRRGDVE